MGRLNLFRVTILVASIAFFGRLAQAEENYKEFDRLIRSSPGYSAKLPSDLCKTLFPNYKRIERPVVVDGQKESFKLFAYTTDVFDSKKPSLVAIDGGPGGLFAPEDSVAIAKLFPEFNVIFFHYRGAGCSDFRTSDSSWDGLMTSDGVAEDLEAIRREYGIEKWNALYGMSYGTIIARRYANRFPNRVDLVILEGLSDLHQPESTKDSSRIVSVIKHRLKNSKNLAPYLTNVNIDETLKMFSAYFAELSPADHFGDLAIWDLYKKAIAESYRKADRPLPKYVSRLTYQAVTYLAYSGEEESSDYPILALLDQFDRIQLSNETRENLESWLLNYEYGLLSYEDPHYIESFSKMGGLSWRVELKMTANDMELPGSSFCLSAPTIVLNGTKDMATPVENVDAFLKNKACAKGDSVALLISGGGHWNMGAVKCLTTYVNQSLKQKKPMSLAPTECSVPVTFKTY